MIAVDANILVYARRGDAPLHARAVEALRELSEGDEAWALPVFSVLQYLRVVTHPRIPPRPTPMAEALASMDSLLASPSVRFLVPGRIYWTVLQRIILDCRIVGSQVFDAQIAALCLEQGADTILTEDRDFSRFPNLTVKRLPL